MVLARVQASGRRMRTPPCALWSRARNACLCSLRRRRNAESPRVTYRGWRERGALRRAAAFQRPAAKSCPTPDGPTQPVSASHPRERMPDSPLLVTAPAPGFLRRFEASWLRRAKGRDGASVVARGPVCASQVSQDSLEENFLFARRPASLPLHHSARHCAGQRRG